MRIFLLLFLIPGSLLAQIDAPPVAIGNWRTQRTPLSLTDPAANRVAGWDDTDNAWSWFTIGSGLSYDHTTHTLSSTASGGSGTVTSFSAGDLAPLFTTSEATVTTTPALTFTLSTAAAHTFLGNNTASTAAPAYVQPAFSDLSGTATTGQLPVGSNFDFTALQTITANDVANNTFSNGLALGHNTTGTPAANIGTSIRFNAETSTTVDTEMGDFVLAWSDVTHATRTAYADVLLVNSAARASKARFYGSGGFSVNNTTDPGAGIISANTGYIVGTAGSTSGKILKSDGSKFLPSTETYDAPGTSGNVLTSDGTNWTSAALTVGQLPVGSNFDFTALQTITTNDVANNTFSNGLALGHNTTGTPADNIGTSIRFNAETSTTVDMEMGDFVLAWSDVTHATRTAYADVMLVNSAARASKARFYGSGGFSVNNTTDPGAGIISANTGYIVGTAGSTSGKILKSDGSKFLPSTETYAAPGTSGNVLTSDGTNWTSAAPANQTNDTAFASSWNGVTTIAPSKNAVYDWAHTFDTDDDGKVNVLDEAAGIANTDSSGVLQTPLTAPTGTIVGTTDTQTLTNKSLTPRVASTASSATPTPNADTTDLYILTALTDATATFGAPTGSPVAGQRLLIRITDSGGPRTLAWNSGTGGYSASSDLALPLTTTASKTMYLLFIYNATGTAKWNLLAKLDNF